MAEERTPLPHQLILDGRRRLTVSGVSDVDSFDDTTVVAHTSLGALTVLGTALHVERLNVETGELSIEGTVTSLTYSEPHQKAKGLLGRLFR
ncbi:MAG: sporulation protein YabP [Clostridia bacterium]|nr:sporulation protein YabP [Clostridia bacterium]